ncbi:hypothetical protein AB0I72_19190 [Nocardiopsis sp. NPDC049922]|uniref:hypothetical protein n=1 Tax=Nocardiopsis sp. NPDC049922 TaxID=3155157 RepID=UPI00340EDFBE
MALITTQNITTAGTAPTFAAAAVGDTTETGSTHFLVVKNGDVSSKTVTITGQPTLESGDTYPDKQYTVNASDEVWVPLLSVYRNENNQAELVYSDTTSVTRAVVKL